MVKNILTMSGGNIVNLIMCQIPQNISQYLIDNLIPNGVAIYQHNTLEQIQKFMRQKTAHIMLIDIDQPIVNWLHFIQNMKLQAEFINCQFIALTDFYEKNANDFLLAGISSIIQKNLNPKLILKQIYTFIKILENLTKDNKRKTVRVTPNRSDRATISIYNSMKNSEITGNIINISVRAVAFTVKNQLDLKFLPDNLELKNVKIFIQERSYKISGKILRKHKNGTVILFTQTDKEFIKSISQYIFAVLSEN